jgi:hypothetical protein
LHFAGIGPREADDQALYWGGEFFNFLKSLVAGWAGRLKALTNCNYGSIFSICSKMTIFNGNTVALNYG